MECNQRELQITYCRDLLPDDSYLSGLTFPVYFTDYSKSAKKVKEWAELPTAVVGKIIETAWGTVALNIRTGEGVAANPKHAFVNTGPEAIKLLAFSPCFLFGGINRGLLTVLKQGLDNDKGILQHWLITLADNYPPVLVARLLTNNGIPSAIHWTRCIGDDHQNGWLFTANQAGELDQYQVALSGGADLIEHKYVQTLRVPDHKIICIDSLIETRTHKQSHILHIAAGTLEGAVLFFQLAAPQGAVIAKTRQFITNAAITSVSLMPHGGGKMYAVGLSNGRMFVCDQRLPNGSVIAHNEYMTRPIKSLAWSDYHGSVLAAQTEGLIFTLSQAETSRHHFGRSWPKTTESRKQHALNSVEKYWKSLLYPEYRNEKTVKAFEHPAVSCAISGPNCLFTYDGGAVMTGVISRMDIRAYSDVELYLWSFLKPLELGPPQQPKEVNDEGRSESLFSDAMEEFKELKRKAIATAQIGGVHIFGCKYFNFEKDLRHFATPSDGNVVTYVDNIMVLNLCASAGAKEQLGWEKPLFAYGTCFGIMHIYSIN